MPPNVDVTRNWMGKSCREWEKHILPLKDTFRRLRLLEIGVFEGLSACWWLNYLLTNDEDFYLGIDPWLPHPQLARRRDMELVKQRAEKNVAPFGEKAMLWRGGSADALRPAPELVQLLDPESFEVIYIDGDHSPAAAMLDSVNSWLLLRPGGILVWDDWRYHRSKHAAYPLHIYLRKFFRLITGKYEILWESFQLGIRKLG